MSGNGCEFNRRADVARRASNTRTFLVALSALVGIAAIAVLTLCPPFARVLAARPFHAAIAQAAGAMVDRAETFFAPRAYPAATIPANAREQALKQMDAMREPSNAAQPSWHPIPTPPSAIATSSGAKPVAAVNAIAIDPAEPTGKTIYAGAAAGGVWKTTDGAHWRPLTDNQPSLMIRSLALDLATAPATIYAGTGARTESGEDFYGAGVMKSADGGKTWTASGETAFAGTASGPGGVSIEALAANPNRDAHEIVLAAVTASSSIGGGIWRSIDGGATWTATLPAPNGSGGFAVAFDTSDTTGRTAYAAIGQSTSAEQDLLGSAASSANGIYVSSDAGANWTRLAALDSLAEPARVGKIFLALSPSSRGTTALYAAVADAETSSEDLLGIFKSSEGGKTWLALTVPPDNLCAPACFDAMAFAASPIDSSTLFAGGTKLYRSTDAGNSWQDATTDRAGSSLRPSEHAIALSADGSLLYAGDDGGLWTSTDLSNPSVAAGSHSWLDSNARVGASGLNVLQLDRNAALTPAATPENSSAPGLPNRVETSLASDPRDAEVAYATFSGFSGINGDALGHVFMTSSGGAQWRDISANLPNIPANQIVVDPDASGTLYVATDIGVFVTNNHGASWSPLGAGLPIVPVTSLSLDDSSRTLTAETYGRGVWAVVLQQSNPVPTVSSITPTSIDVGNGEFDLTVTGTNFVSGSVINFGTTSLTPIGAQSSTSLTAEVPVSAIATAAVINVSVTNPTPGGGTSGTQPFDIQDYQFGPITPTVATVVAGFTAQYQLSMIALNGFNVELTLTCTGLPTDSVCSFAPTDVTPTASGASEQMLVTTIVDSSAPGGPSLRVPPGIGKFLREYRLPIGATIAVLLLMAWLALRTSSRAWRRRYALAASLACFVLAGLVAGCGRRTSGTPVGTYQVTINVAATQINGATTAVVANHQAMVTVIVTQTPP